MKEIQAPDLRGLEDALDPQGLKPITIFLGGVIDNGNSVNWQKQFIEEFKNYDVVLLNPRRDNWDSSLEPVKGNAEFEQQVAWELTAQEFASLNIYVFGANEEQAKNAKAPITLLELGLHAFEETTFVCCPDGYYRKGNIEMLFEMPTTKFQLYDSFEDMISDIKNVLADNGVREGMIYEPNIKPEDDESWPRRPS